MSLDALLLGRLAEWRPDSARPNLDVADEAGGWSARLTADCVDVVGCRLWDLAVRRPAGAAVVDLPARAEQVCRQVTGLLEPLRLLEVDGVRNVALLRSEKPGQVGDDRFYYEVLLEGDGSATLRRYQAPQAGQRGRQQVAFGLTYEALGKLVRDLTF